MVILARDFSNMKNTSKSKMVANFGQKFVLGMKLTNMLISILL